MTTTGHAPATFAKRVGEAAAVQTTVAKAVQQAAAVEATLVKPVEQAAQKTGQATSTNCRAGRGSKRHQDWRKVRSPLRMIIAHPTTAAAPCSLSRTHAGVNYESNVRSNASS